MSTGRGALHQQNIAVLAIESKPQSNDDLKEQLGE